MLLCSAYNRQALLHLSFNKNQKFYYSVSFLPHTEQWYYLGIVSKLEFPVSCQHLFNLFHTLPYKAINQKT